MMHILQLCSFTIMNDSKIEAGDALLILQGWYVEPSRKRYALNNNISAMRVLSNHLYHLSKLLIVSTF